jgi:hypothetical protein
MTYAPSGYTGRIGKPHAAEPMEAEPLNQEPWRATYSKGSSGNSKTGPYDGINPGKMAKPKPWADGASQIDKVSPESVYGGDASYYSAWNDKSDSTNSATIPSIDFSSNDDTTKMSSEYSSSNGEKGKSSEPYFSWGGNGDSESNKPSGSTYSGKKPVQGNNDDTTEMSSEHSSSNAGKGKASKPYFSGDDTSDSERIPSKPAGSTYSSKKPVQGNTYDIWDTPSKPATESAWDKPKEASVYSSWDEPKTTSKKPVDSKPASVGSAWDSSDSKELASDAPWHFNNPEKPKPKGGSFPQSSEFSDSNNKPSTYSKGSLGSEYWNQEDKPKTSTYASWKENPQNTENMQNSENTWGAVSYSKETTQHSAEPVPTTSGLSHTDVILISGMFPCLKKTNL